jgi:hypothetical protein
MSNTIYRTALERLSIMTLYTNKPFILYYDKDLWDGWGNPIKYMDSPMGCGYNVMVFLQLMKRREAFEYIKQIVLSDSDGLMIDNMIKIIRGVPDYSTLSLKRVYLTFSNISRRSYIQHLCKMLRKSKTENRYSYMITKLCIDETSGLGHTAILEYDSFSDIVVSIDPQKLIRKSVDKYISYLENRGSAYKGLWYIAIDQDKYGGKSKKLNKTRKYTSKSNLKKIKYITTYIANMDKTKKVVSKRRKTKQPKFIGGSDEDFMEFVNKYAVVTPYDTSDSGFRKLTPDELALLTKVMADDDKYFAENP